MASFDQEIMVRFADAINRYYDTVEQSNSLLRRLTAAIARYTLRSELRRVLELAYQVAANYGNGGKPLDEAQYQAVLQRLAEAEGYLEGFIADVATMTRQQALARIARYIPPIITTQSVIAASDLPKLPMMPNDRRLDCVRSAKGLPVCRCRLRVVDVGPNSWDVFWDLDPAGIEHCQSCTTLSKTWNPLRIRNGRIEAKAA